jgi:hypothetical protein
MVVALSSYSLVEIVFPVISALELSFGLLFILEIEPLLKQGNMVIYNNDRNSL